MCTAVEVEVDPDTGMVDVTRLVLASDVGKALNPQQVEAQDEGAAVMGVGHSLMEELILDEQRPDREPRRDGLPHSDDSGHSARAPLGAHRE